MSIKLSVKEFSCICYFLFSHNFCNNCASVPFCRLQFKWPNSLDNPYRSPSTNIVCILAEPLIWRKWVEVSGRAVDVEVKEGGRLADARFQALQVLGVTFPDRGKLIDATKSNDIPNTREYGLAFSRSVQTKDSLFQFDLRIYDNKKEPVNVI